MMTLAMAAGRFAMEAHQGQMYGNEHYTVHLAQVAHIAATNGLGDGEFQAACWLHDVLEDTKTTRDELLVFGSGVTALVVAVTDEPGANRRERHERTYPKIAAAGSRAVCLKLCDRIANVEHCWQTWDPRLFMYKREYEGFRRALREESNVTARPLWDRLDRLLGWWEKPQGSRT